MQICLDACLPCEFVVVIDVVIVTFLWLCENPHLGQEKGTGPLARDSQGCETCKDVCLSLLQREAEDRAAASGVLGRPGWAG